MHRNLFRKLIAEFVGSCFLVMVVVGSGIMAQGLSTDNLSILLANTIATGAGLTVLIWIFISISGAHFNPAVSFVMFLEKELALDEMAFFVCFQVLGGLLGVILANAMFGLEFLQIAEKEREGLPLYLGEFIATFGLLLTILGVRRLSLLAVGPAVGLYISAGYWFTSSTSFANPAVTFARGFSNTFAGISPESIFPFLVFQFAGAVSAMILWRFLEDD